MKMRSSTKLSSPLVHGSPAFTLVELLTVVSIIAILSSIVITSFQSLAGGSFDQSVSDLSSTMAQARSYAMANDTYVYVGLSEVNAADNSSTPSAGNGLTVAAVVASKDGTDGFSGGATWSATSNGTFNLVAISKLKRFNGLHLSSAQLSNPGSGSMHRPAIGSPAFYLGTPTGTASFGFGWPLASTSPNYYFSNLIRFGPHGDATILVSTTTTAPAVDYLEIGLQPIRGNSVASASGNNVSAIQVDGMTGTVRAYRP